VVAIVCVVVINIAHSADGVRRHRHSTSRQGNCQTWVCSDIHCYCTVTQWYYILTITAHQ